MPGTVIDGIRKMHLGVVQCPSGGFGRRSYTVPLKKLEHGALLTREAYSALLNLKTLVELAVTEAYTESMETVGLAINIQAIGDPSGALRTAAATLESSIFESAVSEARAKIEVAVDSYEELHEE